MKQINAELLAPSSLLSLSGLWGVMEVLNECLLCDMRMTISRTGNASDPWECQSGPLIHKKDVSCTFLLLDIFSLRLPNP